jgi:hypothetical protein
VVGHVHLFRNRGPVIVGGICALGQDRLFVWHFLVRDAGQEMGDAVEARTFLVVRFLD